MIYLRSTVLPRTILYEFGPATVCRDADGTTWCALCARETCRHTVAVASAIADGTAPAPTRRKASGGKRAGAGRHTKRTEKIQNEGVGPS